jgi:hypothetical protein
MRPRLHIGSQLKNAFVVAAVCDGRRLARRSTSLRDLVNVKRACACERLAAVYSFVIPKLAERAEGPLPWSLLIQI